jgi:hypothetical protein
MSRSRSSDPVRALRRPVVGLLLVLLSIPAGCGLWLTFGYDNGTRHVATLDSLPLPDSWEIVHTKTVGTFPLGSHADRWYLVDSEPVDTAALVKDALQSAGWTIETRLLSSGTHIEDCRAAPGGPVECTVAAHRRGATNDEWFERITISMAAKGRGLAYFVGNDGFRVQDPDRSAVVISARSVSGRDLLRSPTPSPSE